MLRRSGIATLASMLLVTASATAQQIDPAEVFLSGRVSVGSSPYLSVGERVRTASQAEIDYAVFARELVAYIAKEVLPDADDEYAHSSGIPSRLTSDRDLHFRLPPSRFGAHCLFVLRQMGSTLSPVPVSSFAVLGDASPALLTYLVRAGTAVLTLERVWSALNDDEPESATRSRLSLDPKVGTNKVGAYVTFRW